MLVVYEVVSREAYGPDNVYDVYESEDRAEQFANKMNAKVKGDTNNPYRVNKRVVCRDIDSDEEHDQNKLRLKALNKLSKAEIELLGLN